MGNSQYRRQQYITYHGYKCSLPGVAGFIRQFGNYYLFPLAEISGGQGSERVNWKVEVKVKSTDRVTKLQTRNWFYVGLRILLINPVPLMQKSWCRIGELYVFSYKTMKSPFSTVTIAQLVLLIYVNSAAARWVQE